jgi:hypothetical protein
MVWWFHGSMDVPVAIRKVFSKFRFPTIQQSNNKTIINPIK